MQEVVSSIVSCYCARVQRLQAAGMQDVLARDSIFDAVADATTASVAVQVAELMTETGGHIAKFCSNVLWGFVL